jgi:hypothetical protein
MTPPISGRGLAWPWNNPKTVRIALLPVSKILKDCDINTIAKFPPDPGSLLLTETQTHHLLALHPLQPRHHHSKANVANQLGALEAGILPLTTRIRPHGAHRQGSPEHRPIPHQPVAHAAQSW